MFNPKVKIFDTKQRAASTKYIADLYSRHFTFPHTRAKNSQEEGKNVVMMIIFQKIECKLILSVHGQPNSPLFERKLPADVSQWIESWPVKERVSGSIPSQGTCLDCRPGP